MTLVDGAGAKSMLTVIMLVIFFCFPKCVGMPDVYTCLVLRSFFSVSDHFFGLSFLLRVDTEDHRAVLTSVY